jgi:hypothetical protein
VKPALILLVLIPTLYAIERGTVGAVAQMRQARESEAYAWQQVAHLEAENARQNGVIADLDSSRWGYFVATERRALRRAEGLKCRASN